MTPKDKLQPKITYKMIAWPNPPKTCQEVIDLAVRLEQVKPFCKPRTTTIQWSDAPTCPRGCGRGHNGYSYRPLRNNMKEISSTNQTPLNAAITANKKERHWQENLCFYCSRPGHSIAKCRKKKSKKLGKRQLSRRMRNHTGQWWCWTQGASIPKRLGSHPGRLDKPMSTG